MANSNTVKILAIVMDNNRESTHSPTLIMARELLMAIPVASKMYSDHDVQRKQQEKAMKHRERLCRTYEKRATNKFPKIPAVNRNGNDIIRLDISNGDRANEATMLQRNNSTLIV